MNWLALGALILVVVVYAWTAYNIPFMVVGVRSYRREKRSPSKPAKGRGARGEGLPKFSIVVPAKNEATVLPRLLQAVLKLHYPRDRYEVIIVEDGSTDDTVGVCERFRERHKGAVRLVRAAESGGKPSALNRGLDAARGEIVAVFDADNIPEPDVLLNAASYFRDPSVAALQGRTLTVNAESSMLTKFVSYEEAAWYEAFLRGRDVLNLFVHLKGSCQFVRRSVLQSVGGWSAQHLSEDFELSARLTEQGHRIRYAPDVRSWQECPQTLRRMFHQRIRWFRGAMEVALSYGRLMKTPSFRTVDAELTLLGPFVAILSLLAYIIGPFALHGVDSSIILTLTMVGWAICTASIAVGAAALFFSAETRRARDLLWLPFIYAYWSFQVFLVTCALVRIVARMPRIWRRTEKTGEVAASCAVTLPSAVEQRGS
jgi:cellulose synthase/poly-beta-1,6-N-acetylglucosamine synthase-like glycosyltransferase